MSAVKIEKAIKDVLGAGFTRDGLRGVRVYFNVASQNCRPPYVVVTITGLDAMDTLSSGITNLRNTHAEVAVIAESYEDCRNVCDAIHEALHRETELFRTAVCDYAGYDFEPELEIFSGAMTCSLWHYEDKAV